MICPYCREVEIGDNTGPSTCPACKAEFRIDDRGECVFADLERLRMPVHGQVCPVCGLVQEGRWDWCVRCGAGFSNLAH